MTAQLQVEVREHWGNPIEFFLSCVGYSVGLGNIWRFPYILTQNGGGAFLIPYFIFLFICGMPLFFLEMIIGQYSGSSCIRVWNLAPIFKGIGWGMVIVSGVACLYFNIIMAWVLYYLYHSFQWELPWRKCGHEWNTANCYSYYDINQQIRNGSLLTDVAVKISSNISNNATRFDRPRSAAEEFWLYKALNVSSGIEEIGGLQWELFIAFLAAWLLTYVCLYKGIKSSGKIVYVTALAPYFFLTLIIIKGVALPGSWRGIEYYLKPKWESLATWKIWSTAAMQIFFSLGPGWGGIITMASYNRFDHRVMRDGVIIPIVCCLTSFYGGFAIFSVIGHMAHVANISDINQVIQVGPGLAFVAYPEALAQLPGGAIWSVLFFLMLITMGLDTMFATFETMTSGFVDEFPQYLRKHKQLFTVVCIVVEMLLGIVFSTRAGIYFFQIIDWYSASISVMFIGYLELIVLCYIYGVRTVWKNMTRMLGNISIAVKGFWAINWAILAPLALQLIIISSIYQMEQPIMDSTYRYPWWAIALGWFIASWSVIPIPLVAIFTMRDLGWANWRQWFKPNEMHDAIERAQQVEMADVEHLNEGVPGLEKPESAGSLLIDNKCPA